ncbi:MAG TPA: hypothetical protein VH250_12630 [Granulicella sp.]|jgi:hypothetical protein|nr:hypothetical protein [Granulicella sp.]
MKVTRFDESNIFDDLDKIDAWLTGRGFTQRNRLRIYRENLIAMRDSDDDMATVCRLDSGDELLRRLSKTLTL